MKNIIHSYRAWKWNRKMKREYPPLLRNTKWFEPKLGNPFIKHPSWNKFGHTYFKEKDKVEVITFIHNKDDAYYWGITKPVYDKRLKEVKEKQRDIELQLENHTNADENYSLSATQLLSLAQRAVEIFKRSETEEKRQLLNFVFQNFQLKNKKLLFELRNPFQAILEYKKRPVLLPLLDALRTVKWDRLVNDLGTLSLQNSLTMVNYH